MFYGTNNRTGSGSVIAVSVVAGHLNKGAFKMLSVYFSRSLYYIYFVQINRIPKVVRRVPCCLAERSCDVR